MKHLKYSNCCMYPMSGDMLEKEICPLCKEHCEPVELDEELYGDMLEWPECDDEDEDLKDFERCLDGALDKYRNRE